MKKANAYHRKDGRWDVRVSMYVDGERKSIPFYGKTEEEANEKADRFMETERNAAKCAEKSLTKMTVKDLIYEFLSRKQSTIKKSTLANYRTKSEKHIIPALGHIQCCNITANNIYEFIESMREKSLTERYIHDNVVLLKSVFRYANKIYSVKNVLDGIILPKGKKPVIELLSNAELSRLDEHLTACLDLKNLGILIVRNTALRIGEICALQWKDIDLEERVIYVKKTLQRVQVKGGKKKTELTIMPPKSDKSVRVVPIPDWLVEYLLKYKNNDDFYVISGNNRPIEPRILQYRFVKILKELDLKHVHFHSLRHSFATNCIALGFDIKTLSEILGHSSVKITLELYVHSDMERKKKCMNLIPSPINKVSA